MSDEILCALNGLFLVFFLILGAYRAFGPSPEFLNCIWRVSFWGITLIAGTELLWAYNFAHCGRTSFPTVLIMDVLPTYLPLLFFRWFLGQRLEDQRAREQVKETSFIILQSVE